MLVLLNIALCINYCIPNFTSTLQDTGLLSSVLPYLDRAEILPVAPINSDSFMPVWSKLIQACSDDTLQDQMHRLLCRRLYLICNEKFDSKLLPPLHNLAYELKPFSFYPESLQKDIKSLNEKVQNHLARLRDFKGRFPKSLTNVIVIDTFLRRHPNPCEPNRIKLDSTEDLARLKSEISQIKEEFSAQFNSWRAMNEDIKHVFNQIELSGHKPTMGSIRDHTSIQNTLENMESFARQIGELISSYERRLLTYTTPSSEASIEDTDQE